MKGESNTYTPFEGICLTDTFQLYEDNKGLLVDNLLKLNTERVNKQKAAPIMVVLGNPPYSTGQKSQNDNAQNISYPAIEKRIADTYANYSTANNLRNLYDTYIKAFRWASDRIIENNKNGGVIAFVTNAGWLDAKAMDGMRKCLAEEFSSIYVFNLRGNQRTSGEVSRREGGKIFGAGSRAAIAITILVNNPSQKDKSKIYYYDIGDYLSREQKLEKLVNAHDILNETLNIKIVNPDIHFDWFNQRNALFDSFIPLADRDNKQNERVFFAPYYSPGVVTSRDAWCFNFSEKVLKRNIRSMVEFYNIEREGFNKITIKNRSTKAEDFISRDDKKIGWSRGLINNLKKNQNILYKANNVTISSYRPFTKLFIYSDKFLNEVSSIVPKLFPTPQHENIVICISTLRPGFPIISDCIPEYQLNSNGQCFPLYYYERIKESSNSLFSTFDEVDGYIRHHGITDYALKEAKDIYNSDLSRIAKDQIFYYVYGLLHSREYIEIFSADLMKVLPRLPLVAKSLDFLAFSKAGKDLAKLHLNYENVKPFGGKKISGNDPKSLIVEKMRFGKKSDNNVDKTVIHYNSHYKITGIPLEAYDYIVNNKSAVEWVMERYQVKVDKNSGIKNDPNDWAKEHDDPSYILNLLLRIITVSLETMEIVKGLPKLKF
jgi:predicted helicase